MNKKMGNYEVNGNLEDIENFDVFLKYIGITMNIFIETFGNETMNKIDLYIDNATCGSGYTPITTVILKKYVIIKLGIADFSNKEQIVYQLAHELCHYVFYSLKGLSKKLADKEEENICSAMSLVIINKLFPDSITKWVWHVMHLKNDMYSVGATIATEVNYDITKLRQRIYHVCGVEQPLKCEIT